MQRLRNGDDLEKAVAALCRQSPALASIAASCPDIPLRLLPPGFAGLAEVIAGQMISKQAAAAIFTRLAQACAPLTAENYLALAPEALAAIGLTRAKQATLATVARAITAGELDLDALGQIAPEDALKALTGYRGIGIWTAEVYLMFCAGHADIFPAGDLALRIAAGDALGHGGRIEAGALRELAHEWQPWRSVAARILWSHYATMTKRNVMPVG